MAFERLRLDKFLSQKFPNYSRAFLKSQIMAGNVLINGQIKKPSYILKEKDDVKISLVEPKKHVLQPNLSIKLKIIYEDKNIIAINKPAGISAHPAKPKQTDTIANALLAYYPDIKNVGDPSTSSGQADLRPGIVHRLDKDTSGIMVVAKNQRTFDWLKKQFAERKVVKKYIALVCGKIKEQKGIITKPIGKTKDFRKRTIAPIKEQKEAITGYEVIKKFHTTNVIPAKAGIHAIDSRWSLPRSDLRGGNDKLHFTLLEIEPKTGRTHQIRVHLAAIGHPVAGDSLYGFKRQIQPQELKRQFLHASYLKFSLSDGRIIELKSELPEDLQRIINTLS